MTAERFFVYGTLKRGQCRENCWPAKPLSVRIGFVRGALLDLHAYPGLVAGIDWVRGEIWQIEPLDVADTLRVLDVIEGFEVGGQSNYYDRQIADVYAVVGDSEPCTAAHTYWLVDRTAVTNAAAVARRGGQDFVEWPTGATS